jgi:WD40 repeat protein
MKTHDKIATMGGMTNWVTTLGFSPDGNLLAASDLDGVRVWDVESRKQLHLLRHDRQGITTLVFQPTGKAIVSAGTSLAVWDLGTQKAEVLLTKNNQTIMALAFSPDGNFLAFGGTEKIVQIMDMRSRKIWGTFDCKSGYIRRLVFLPNKKAVAVACGEVIQIWDVETGKKVNSLEGHQSSLRALALSPDGKTLASGSWDGAIKLWDLQKNKEIQSLLRHKGTAYALAFSPDGKHLVSGGGWYDQSGELMLWKILKTTNNPD